MVEDRIGYRYARSVYGLADERKEIETVYSDIQMIADTLKSSPDLVNMLRSPLVNTDKKQVVISRIFDSHLKSELVKNLLEIIVRKRREQFLPNIAQSFLEMYDEAHKILRGTLVSAHKLDDKTLAEIKKTMEAQSGQTFELVQEVNPELIGGFTLKVGDKLFDGSIAGSIRQARREFIK